MTKFTNLIDEILNESEELFEMCNIRKEETHLPVNVWLDEIGAFRTSKHNLPRLKFQSNRSNNVFGKGIPMSISKKPEILISVYETDLNNYEIGQIKNFIVRNYDLLIKHWNQK